MPTDNTALKIELLRKQLSAIDTEIKAQFRKFEESLNVLSKEKDSDSEVTNYPSLQGVKALCNANLGYWVTARGNVLPIRLMSTSHMKACIDYIETAMNELNEAHRRLAAKRIEFHNELRKR